jgi:hypothetical protein
VTGPAPAPTSYRIVGPPDILHDLQRDFEDVGWRVSVVRWHAVVTAPPEDHGHTPPAWPVEVTLTGVDALTHEEACRLHMTGEAIDRS